jgi:CheY-like chemotaxis protein
MTRILVTDDDIEMRGMVQQLLAKEITVLVKWDNEPSHIGSRPNEIP